MDAGEPASGKSEYNPHLFARWLRILLRSFYSDQEAVIVELLLREERALRDSSIAKLVKFPVEEVRKSLEIRLLKDCIVEKQVEMLAKTQRTYYAISPLVVASVEHCILGLEAKLAEDVNERNEMYYCPKCRQVMDALAAASNINADTFVFECDTCRVELKPLLNFTCQRCKKSKKDVQLQGSLKGICDCGGQMDAQDSETFAKTQNDRLHRFRAQCQELIALTKEARFMSVPRFTKEGCSKEGYGSTASKSVLQVAARTLESPRPRAQSVPSPEWFTEVMGTVVQPSLPAKRAAEEGTIEIEDISPTGLERQLREGFKRKIVAEGRKAIAGCKATVTVQGVQYPFFEAQQNDELQERMTEDEYEAFFKLDRSTCRETLASK
eukprot:gnl/MRDRNA2_/MRDRNA2_78870_c0_seq1.p1 gnl/MRDRNA2_/MRDRNA2_78870_c0~~gnl/MRDRNA2_/MRDRNA2_78870_c0_seq1.p1  ORF type:complete len:382 (+),score=74.06 gnl/MRDRNA2_/MRDRNA2_78870_c0_seq1:190-1335(+)